MCLSFSNQKKVLRYFEWFVGFKGFSISVVEGLVTLNPLFITSFGYGFKVIDNKLVVEPYNQRQKVCYKLNVHNTFEKAYVLEIEKTAYIGYHIYQFPKEYDTKTCFSEFSIKDDEATLPVMFGEEHIQMISDNIVVDQFAIPNQDMYVSFCELYHIEPKRKIVKFLKKLFKSYS